VYVIVGGLLLLVSLVYLLIAFSFFAYSFVCLLFMWCFLGVSSISEILGLGFWRGLLGSLVLGVLLSSV